MRVAAGLLVVCFATGVHAGGPPEAAEGPAPVGLMCELLEDPRAVEITDPRPEFSWIVSSAEDDDRQTAYQVRVAASPAALERPGEVMLDSGKVASDRSVAVTYAGKPLESRRSYSWTVRTWNKQGTGSAWAAPQTFRTGDLGTYSTPRYPLDRTEIAPVAVVETGAKHYFVDFGRAAFASLRLTLTGPPCGSRVVVHMGEAVSGPNTVNRAPGGSIRYQRAELALGEGRHTYTVPLREADGRMMPPEIGPVMPFRYVEVEDCPTALDRDSARQVAVHYRFNDVAATFDSSDPALNEVWRLCHYTMKATSFCGVFVDGDRERLPYEADAYINQLGYYACDREFTISRHSHEFLMTHPTWPPEWKHHSVFMAWADYLYTGDADSLAAHYDRLKGEKLLADRARADGLLDTAGLRDLVDWPASERDGFEFRPVNTVYNAFYYRSLVLMADIAAALARSGDEAPIRSDARRVLSAINEKLFDPQSGLYVDGEGGRHSSQHANMFALAFGLVPEARRRPVVEFVKSRGMACSVYGAQYLMEALFDAGQADHALALMTAPTDRNWSHMVRDVGTTITLEAWDGKYKPNQDWNHAWGAAPANLIPRKLMGVEPSEPGFRTMTIRPRPGPMEWAAMDLPTIRGPVHVDFRSSSAQFDLNVHLPANTTARVYVPLRGSADDPTVVVDGTPRQGKVDGPFLLIDPVGSGKHRFTRRSDGAGTVPP